MDKITNSVLSKVGILGGFVASIFLPPKSLAPIATGIFAGATAALLYLKSIWL